MTKSNTVWSILLLLIFCCSCQSKPVADAKPSTEASVSEKATPGLSPTRTVELVARTSLAPRRKSEVESAIILDPAVTACMRAEFKDGTEKFAYSVQGRLSARGEIQAPLVITTQENLKKCLMARFKTLNLGRGQSGTFKLKVERAGPFEIGGKASKTFLLDLDDFKKLQ
jgi:hypothetical protein